MNEEAQIERQALQPLRYGRLFFLNSLAIGLAWGFNSISQMGTNEFFGIALPLGAILFLPPMLLLMLIEGIVFFATKRILKWKCANDIISRRWLLIPPLVFASLLLLYGWRETLPSQRLSKLCGSKLPSARNIHVAGFNGFLAGQWLAVFQVEEADFEKIIRHQDFKAAPMLNLTNKLGRSYFVQTSTFRNMPKLVNPSSFARVFSKNGEIPRGGISAVFDPATSTAIIFRAYHD